MQNRFSQWVIAATLVIYPIACITLVLQLAMHPLGGEIDSEELTSNTLLPDFTAVDQPQERVQLFIETLLPLVEQKNNLLLGTRERLLDIRHEYKTEHKIGYLNREQLNLLREEFSVSTSDYPSDAQAIEVAWLA